MGKTKTSSSMNTTFKSEENEYYYYIDHHTIEVDGTKHYWEDMVEEINGEYNRHFAIRKFKELSVDDSMELLKNKMFKRLMVASDFSNTQRKHKDKTVEDRNAYMTVYALKCLHPTLQTAHLLRRVISMRMEKWNDANKCGHKDFLLYCLHTPDIPWAGSRGKLSFLKTLGWEHRTSPTPWKGYRAYDEAMTLVKSGDFRTVNEALDHMCTQELHQIINRRSIKQNSTCQFAANM